MGSEAYRITNTGYVVWHSRLSAAHPLPLWIVTSSTRFRLQLFCKDTCMNFAVPPSVRELPPIIITYSTAVYIDRSQSWRENTSVWIQRAAGAEASRTMVLNLCFGRQSCERKGRGAELWTVRLQHSVMLRLLSISQCFPFNHSCSISWKQSKLPLQITVLLWTCEYGCFKLSFAHCTVRTLFVKPKKKLQ